jgi:exonuclease III
LIDNKTDIAFLQETFITDRTVNAFNRDWEGSAFHSLSDSCHSRGVSILIRKGLDFKILNCSKSDDGRKVLLNIEIDGKIFCRVSVYAPNDITTRIQFFKRFPRWIKQKCCNDDGIIIGADLNVAECAIDRSTGTTDRSSAHFVQAKTFISIDDTFRKLYPEKREYTYIDPSGSGIMSRIDYIIASTALSARVKAVHTRPAPVPDHKAVFALFHINNGTRGKGYWKLNTNLLHDDKYINDIKYIISETMREYESTLPYKLIWDLCKIKIKEFSVKYGICQSRKRKENMYNIENKIQDIDKSLAEKFEKNLYDKRKLLQEQLDNDILLKARGAQIRSRAKWIEDGERSNSYFLRLESHRQTNNKIELLLTDDGRVCDNDDEILNEACTFYKSLYSSNEPCKADINKYLNETLFIRVLSEYEADACEGEITLEECTTVVQKLKIDKSPGLGGLTSEFYQTLWPHIGIILINVYNESFEEEVLSPSQRQSVLTLIFKKDDREKLLNYRPISLTNIDYKILASSLANRLQLVLDKIISTDQAGFIKKRFIGHNIRLIQDVLEYSDRHQTKGLMLFLDFKKAFDSLEWDFMIAALRRFNFAVSL